MPPVTPFIGLGRTCFFTWLMPSTVIRRSSTRASTTPRLPLSLPAITTTSSPLRIRCIAPSRIRLQHLRRQRDDLHEPLGAQLASDRPEDAGADRLVLFVDQDGRVAVEPNEAAVGPRQLALGAYDHRARHLALLHLGAGDRLADRDDDDIADRGVAPP